MKSDEYDDWKFLPAVDAFAKKLRHLRENGCTYYCLLRVLFDPAYAGAGIAIAQLCYTIAACGRYGYFLKNPTGHGKHISEPANQEARRFKSCQGEFLE